MAEHGVGRVVVADAEVERERLLGVLRDCKTVSVKVSLLPATFSALGPSVEVDDVQGITVLGINPPVLSRSSRIAKRGLDLVGAGAAERSSRSRSWRCWRSRSSSTRRAPCSSARSASAGAAGASGC